MMSAQNYSSVNGHTNVFWGWGREDSDIEHRIHNQHMKIEKPEIFDSGTVNKLSQILIGQNPNPRF